MKTDVMAEPSDWDPLPEPTLEVWRGDADAGVADTAAAAARARAEQALRELQERLATAGPRDPLARAAERLHRREVATRAPFAEAVRPLRSSLQPEQVPLPVHYETGRDPRQDEHWFGHLPAEEQERLRLQWQRQLARRTRPPQRWGRRLLRGAGAGAAVFLLAGLLQAPLLGLGVVPAMLAIGAVAGALMQFTQRGRFQCSLVGGATYLCAMVLPMAVRAGDLAGMVGQILPVLYGLVIVTWASGLVGLDREMQVSGGWARH